MSETIFSKIIRKEIPAKIVFENERIMAFRDVAPQAPVHILIIPKENYRHIGELNKREHKELIGELVQTAAKIAVEENIADEGYRLVINTGKKGGQTVEHLHIHLIGGRQMQWPPG